MWDWFQVEQRVRQGCVISPWVFSLVVVVRRGRGVTHMMVLQQWWCCCYHLASRAKGTLCALLLRVTSSNIKETTVHLRVPRTGDGPQSAHSSFYKAINYIEDLQQKLAPGNPTLNLMNSTYRGYGFACCQPLCCASCFGWNSSRFAQSSWLAQFYTEFEHALWSKTRSLNLFGHWTAVLDPTSKGLQLFFKALGTVPADSSRIGAFL